MSEIDITLRETTTAAQVARLIQALTYHNAAGALDEDIEISVLIVFAGHEIDIVEGCPLGKTCGDDVGIVLGDVLRCLLRNRQIGWRRRRCQTARRFADHANIIGARSGDVAFGENAVGARTRQTSFGLGDVGLRDLADLETITGRAELTGQHLLVVDLQVEHGLVAQQIRIGRRGIDQHALFGRVQGRAAALHEIFGAAGFGKRTAAAIERLAHAELERIGRARACGVDVVLLDVVFGLAALRRERHGRTPVGQRARHAFVRRTLARAVGEQLGIGAIRGGQRVFDGLCLDRRCAQRGGAQKCGRQHPHSWASGWPIYRCCSFAIDGCHSIRKQSSVHVQTPEEIRRGIEHRPRCNGAGCADRDHGLALLAGRRQHGDQAPALGELIVQVAGICSTPPQSTMTLYGAWRG